MQWKSEKEKIVQCMVAGIVAAALAAGCSGMPAQSASSGSHGQRFAEEDATDIMMSSSGEEGSDEQPGDDAATLANGVSSSSSSMAAESESSSSSQAVELDQLDVAFEEAVAASGMDASVAVLDLTTGDHAGFQASNKMVSASMIKLTIAAAFLERVKAGDYSLDDFYVLRTEDIVGGTGTLSGLGAGVSVSYRDLLMRMIDVSDNTGANVLIDAAGGMEAVSAEAQKLGLTATELNRYMMDSGAMAAGVENYTSAEDCATLLKMIYEGTFIDADSSALVMQALEQQQDYGGILGGLPDGTVFAHKTGTLATVRHDGGIVKGERPFVIVVLCGGDGFSEQGALSLMAQVSSVASESLGLNN